MTSVTNDTANNNGQGERIVLKRSLNGIRYNIAGGVIAFTLIAIFCFAQGLFLFGCLSLTSLLIFPVGYLYALHDHEPKVIMDEKGIYAKGVGQFTWESIQEIWPEYYRRVCILVLKLKDNEHVRFGISSLTMQPDDIRYYIEKQIAKHAEKNK